MALIRLWACCKRFNPQRSGARWTVKRTMVQSRSDTKMNRGLVRITLDAICLARLLLLLATKTDTKRATRPTARLQCNSLQPLALPAKTGMSHPNDQRNLLLNVAIFFHRMYWEARQNHLTCAADVVVISTTCSYEMYMSKKRLLHTALHCCIRTSLYLSQKQCGSAWKRHLNWLNSCEKKEAAPLTAKHRHCRTDAASCYQLKVCNLVWGLGSVYPTCSQNNRGGPSRFTTSVSPLMSFATLRFSSK